MAQRDSRSPWIQPWARFSGRTSRSLRTLALAAGILVLAVISLSSGVFASRSMSFHIEENDMTSSTEAVVDEPTDRETGGDEAPPPAEMVVDVSGAVMSPQVVIVPEGARVADAIEAAGGLAPDADVSALNRAAPVVDGGKIDVPRKGEVAARDASAGDAESTAEGAGLININMADASELDALPGVGPATARAIVEDREANGPFTSPEDLMRVSGIGEKKYEKLKSQICV